MDTMRQSTGQDTGSATQNAEFFKANEHFVQHVASMDTYRHISRAIDGEIAGARRLLDVGNGGVFAYDTSLAEQIVGVDLCHDHTSPSPAKHITLRKGDALALEEPDAAYDVILESGLLHHLVGADVQATFANIRQAIAETHRVLEPGGRLVVAESCVSPRVFPVERRLFRGLRYLAQTPLMRHPATLQFPPATIAEVIRNRFGNVAVAPIPVGRWIVQFNLKWPSALTPARPYLFTATRG
jgi:SAM-dependent methyltransferase